MKKRSWVQIMLPQINIFANKATQRFEPGLLNENRKHFLCAMPFPLLSSLQILWGAAQHRGSILASHSAAQGLNSGAAKIFSL